MNIGVFGLGATGGLFATHLAQDHTVHVLARGARGAHALTSGLRVSGLADLSVTLPEEQVHLLDAPDAGLPALALDALLLCVKAHQIEPLLPMLPALLAPDGVVVYLGNGLGVIERLAQAMPGRAVAGSSTHGAMQGDGSMSVWTGKGEVALGTWPGGAPSASVDALADCISGSGLAARRVGDARQQIWTKALLNIAINPLCALAGVRNGEMLHTPLFDAGLGLMLEAEQVGRRHGVNLPSIDELVTTMVDVLAATADNRCSMLEDVRAGRPTEIDALNGYVVNLAEQHGIMATQNAQVTALIHALRR
ncbi:MAG TPA: 2-dehydropantoate 2-reductase [Candidatus Poseidoniaceae archaeon]|nr:2-dehydropantoate 2-reductase [Candidatus Poseidoniaceae archaeon]HII96214.1 2-dehydropantoate 2-reductase [Candidatus Poseidoniaceae archaeon]